jgi:hypothetical protein
MAAVCQTSRALQFDLTLGLVTLTPITSIHERVRTWGEISGRHIDLQVCYTPANALCVLCFSVL